MRVLALRVHDASALLGFADGPLLRYLTLYSRAEHLMFVASVDDVSSQCVLCPFSFPPLVRQRTHFPYIHTCTRAPPASRSLSHDSREMLADVFNAPLARAVKFRDSYLLLSQRGLLSGAVELVSLWWLLAFDCYKLI